MLRQQKLEFESQASAMPARPSSHNCIVLNVLTSQYNIFDKKMFLNPRTLHCTKMTVGLVPILYSVHMYGGKRGTYMFVNPSTKVQEILHLAWFFL